jgi:hypothetical protein
MGSGLALRLEEGVRVFDLHQLPLANPSPRDAPTTSAVLSAMPSLPFRPSLRDAPAHDKPHPRR